MTFTGGGGGGGGERAMVVLGPIEGVDAMCVLGA